MMNFNKLIHLPIWWYGHSLAWFKRFFRNLLVFLDNRLAVSLMIRMLLVPMFHDTSIVGRVLSLLFRLVRFLVGGIILILTILAMGFWLISWLSLPVIMIFGLKEVGWLILLILWLGDILRQIKKPGKIKADKEVEIFDIKDYLLKDFKKLVKKSKGDSSQLKKLLLTDAKAQKLLIRLEIAPQAIENLKTMITYKYWLKGAYEEARQLGDEQIDSRHFLLSLFKYENWQYKEALETIKWLNKQRVWSKTPFLWDKEYEIRPMGGVNRAWTGIPTPILDKFSSDLTARAQKHEQAEIIGKKEPVDQIIKVLSRKKQNNVLIVGEPGSGKTTLVKGIAQEIVRGVKAKSLSFKRLVMLNTAKLAAGANSGELNDRITKIIEEITAAENIVLFIDEVHNLASLNQDLPETSDLFIALEPPLSEGAFQFIGTTSTENFKKYIEPNEAFARLFEAVELVEPNVVKTLETLQYVAWELERSEKVTITNVALKKIITLADQFIHDRVFPDKAVNLLDELVAIVKTQDKNLATSVDVEKLVSKKTKIPLTKLTKKEAESLLNLEKKLHLKVIGQDEAITAVADAIRRARTKLKDPDKPIASFLFAGPTGVGKTETAKTLAEEFFGSEKVMIRLDMSEYQNLDSLNRLIGAPPGKGGADAGGQLTEAVRHQPYTLVLLDEIEKAHPKILNLFLQVLDDGRLTDSQGRTVDFNSTIIITTTNVGTRELISGKGDAKKEIEAHFPPEFLNRFTGVIVFKSLNQKEIEAITKLKLSQLKNELLKQGVKIDFTQDVIKKIAKLGFSTKWGGRQVDRVIQEKIANQLAKKILKGEVKKNKTLIFSLKDL